MKRFNKILIMLMIMVMVITGCSSGVENPVNADKGNSIENEISSNQSTNDLSKYEIGIDIEQERPSSEIDGELEVHFIDVGQGDSVLIKQGEHNMLIDAGDNHKGQDVVNYLKQQNIKTLDYVIGTHPHADHIGGLDDVINEFDVKSIIMPEKIHTTKTFEDVLNAIAAKNLKITKAVAGNKYELGNAKFTILSPISNNDNNLNNHSVSIRLEHGDNSFMFTGDAEAAVEQEIINNDMDIQADVLKAGHHGSSTSNSTSFVGKVNPDYVVIQVGEGNKYNHPNVEIVDRFQDIGASIYRNDLHGSIIAKSDGVNIEFVSEKMSTSNTDNKEKATIPVEKEINEESDVSEKPIDKPLVEEPVSRNFIGTKTTKKFHKDNCRHVPKEENRAYFVSSDEAINEGYTPCKVCNP